MKFQIPNMHHSEVNRRTHMQTDRQAESNMPFQLFQSWGHNKTVLGVAYTGYPLSINVHYHNAPKMTKFKLRKKYQNLI